MPKLLRPYIPVPVRLQVALRQTWNRHDGVESNSRLLKRILAELTRRLGGPLHLDHDPALENRRKVFRKGVHVEYDPPANDPNHLVYRTVGEHYIKTHVRGDGAQYSDTALAKRERRRIKGKKTTRPLKSANRWPPKGSRKLSSKRRSL